MKHDKENKKSKLKNFDKANTTITAVKAVIQIISSNKTSIINSLMFKTYIKAFCIENSPLKINNSYELALLNNKFNMIITKVQEKNSNELIDSNDLIIAFDSNTEIELFSGFSIEDELSKLSLNDNNENEGKDINSLVSFIKEQLKDDLLCLDSINIDNFINSSENNMGNEISEDYAINTLAKYISLGLNREEFMNVLKHKETNVNSNLNTKDFSSKLISILKYRGIILSGEAGSGKTHTLYSSIKKHLTLNNKNLNRNENSTDKELISIDNLNNIFLLKLSSTEPSDIKTVFNYAKLLNNTIVLIPKHFTSLLTFENQQEQSGSSAKQNIDHENKFCLALINEVELINQNNNVLVIVETLSNSEDFYRELRLSGRFDLNISVVLPDLEKRKKIVMELVNQLNHCLKNEEILKLAEKTQGFTPSDLVCVFKVALSNSNKENAISFFSLEEALQLVKPINLKEITIDIPKVLWTDIGGNKPVIDVIRRNIEWPLKNPQAFKRLGISPPNGILLYGPPGCSKTLIAKALATESGLSFLAVKGPELFSKYVGDSEKAIRNIFKKARMSSPSIIFFDEIDSMAEQRGSDSGVSDKVLCQMLNEMDGIESRKQVVIVGATNRPDILDKALIRPGRFDRLLYIPPPDKEARREIFKINIKKLSVNSDVDVDYLSEISEDFSGAEINMVCMEAGVLALAEDIESETISQKHFISAVNGVKPNITAEMKQYYREFSEKNKDVNK